MTILTRPQYRRYRRRAALLGWVVTIAVLGQSVGVFHMQQRISLLSERLELYRARDEARQQAADVLDMRVTIHAAQLTIVNDILRRLVGEGDEDSQRPRGRIHKTPL